MLTSASRLTSNHKESQKALITSKQKSVQPSNEYDLMEQIEDDENEIGPIDDDDEEEIEAPSPGKEINCDLQILDEEEG